MTDSTRLTIERLGAQGDGIAKTPRGQAYVPFALPGETVTAALEGERGTLMALIERAPERVEPPCRHFGTCGGCALQHLEASAYHAWKRDKVVQALAGRGIETVVDPLVTCAPESRRRAAFTARRTDRGIELGYNEAQSNQLVDIEECPILVPEIVAALPLLRDLAGIVAATGAPFRLLVTATASGLDVAAASCRRWPPPRMRWPRWRSAISARRRRWPTCSRAPAPSRCDWRRWSRSTPWRPTPPRSQPSTAPSASPPG
jgi:23S rRNA (uracil1939-C5)-methyltransferase